MRRLLPLVPFAILLTACGSGNSGAIAKPTATTPPVAAPSPTTPSAQPTATAVVSKEYASFVGDLCHAFSTGDAQTIINALPYYQYNSGLRYGMFGDGEGQTGDPGLMRGWMSAGHVRCVRFTPDLAGHGTVLTKGWSQPGPWSLIELDTYSGKWKINDFTFGRAVSLRWAMHSAGPLLRFSG